VALAAALICCAAGGAAWAQHKVPVLRSHEQDSQHTQNLPGQSPYWYLDTVIDPRAPGARETRVIPEIIAREIGDYMDGEAWQKAEDAARLLVAIAGDRPASHYNLACALARQGKRDEAFTSLEKAVELGWRHYEHLAHLDPDLETLRGDSRFAALVRSLEQAIRADSVDIEPLRVDSVETVTSDLAQKIPDILARYHVPGASVSLVRGGKVVWSEAFGVSDERTGQAVTANTRFPLRSGSRLLAAIMALQLEEQGIWDLDDQLSQWLADTSFADAPKRNLVTLRSAMNFTAGLTHHAPLWIPDSIDAEIAETLRLNPDRAGSTYTYTVEAFLAVGRAIERALEASAASADDPASEQFDGSYAQLVQARVLRPLQMTATLLRQPTRDGVAIATGHTEYGTAYRSDIASPRKPVDRMYSTANDLGALVAMLAAGESDCEAEAVLSPGSIEALATPGLSLSPPDDSSGGVAFGFGLGTTVYDTPVGRCVEIADVEFGCGALLRWYPESQCGVVILFNSDTGYEAARRIAHLALGGI
jgi:CubicO group peptidase (beta-lactamase class C family)